MFNLLNALVTGMLEGIWRRWFGSDSWKWKILNKRFLKHLIGGGGLFVSFLLSGLSWYEAIYCALVVQGLVWAPGHGPFFDMGQSGEPDKKMLERYNEVFYHKWLDKWFKDNKYCEEYDFCGMAIRYTWPCLFLAPVLGLHVLVIGLIVASVYGFMWKLYNSGYIDSPTEKAEVLTGFICGFMFMC